MAKKQLRRTVSMNRELYDRFHAYCRANGVSMSSLVEEMLVELEGGLLPPPKPEWKAAAPDMRPRWRFDPVVEVRAADERVVATLEHGQGTPRLSETVRVVWSEAVAELVYDSLPDEGMVRTRTSSPLRPAEASHALDTAIARMLDAYDRVAESASHCAICRVRSKNARPFVPRLAGEGVVAVCTTCALERRELDGRRAS